MKTPLLILSCILTAAFCAAKPLVDFDDRKEEPKISEQEVSDVQEQLDALQEQIRNKEIPPIEFAFNSAELKPLSKKTLDMVAELITKHPYLKLMVFGHTCDIGTREYNKKLSQRRAESVKHYLIEVGVMGEYVKAKGFGLEKPIAPNDCEENRAKNRRVEFLVTTRWWQSVF
ncbi:MAG: OmpA family protein [Elusimicrobiota bacterium]|jgi:OOP family OmpA-OmpF porin